MLANQDLTAFERLTVPVAWPREEVARLFRLRLELGWGWAEIACELGRTESGVKSKFKYEQHNREVRAPSVPFVREPVPESVLAEQARRLSAPFRDLAGAVFSDPPVGFSALDRRRSEIS
jgi:hypothetical protein